MASKSCLGPARTVGCVPENPPSVALGVPTCLVDAQGVAFWFPGIWLALTGGKSEWRTCTVAERAVDLGGPVCGGDAGSDGASD